MAAGASRTPEKKGLGMRRSIEFEGVNDLDAWLQSFIKDNEAWIPQTAASILSAEASRAFVEPTLRIEPWAPLKASTRNNAGRQGSKYRSARTKRNEWALKEQELRAQVREATGKKRKSLEAKRKAASVKAASWRKRAIDERNKAGGMRRPLIDTGRLWHSLTYQGAIVTSDARYAGYHQWGTGEIPARPFVPVTATGQTTEHAAKAITEALGARLKQILGS